MSAGRDEATRAAALLDAQAKAAELFAAVGESDILVAGARDSEASEAIRRLAAERFGVEKHWHKRIVRSGPNTLQPYQVNPPDRVMTDDDIVFADFGPLFGAWEADFGRTWVIGDDAHKLRLRDDLAEVFRAGKDLWARTEDLTGSDLYAEVVSLAVERGWEFGNVHCGHIVGEFPHENVDGERVESYLAPGNDKPLRTLDPSGRVVHWILEIHLVDRAREFGGFYEELLTLGHPPAAGPPRP